MKNLKRICHLLLLITISSSCQNTKHEKMTVENKSFEIKWQENASAPIGFPIDVYKGGLKNKFNNTSLYLGTIYGPWGKGSSGMSNSVKSVPDKIDVTWLSYAENKFYHIDSEIDQNKIIALFKEGYTQKGADGKLMNVVYDAIVVGFAPGGGVVIWVSGAGKQVEIGRYLGKEITISKEEIATLDTHERLLFEPEYRKKIMENELIVPKAVQEANKNKPIPFGLWDSYREKYSWKPIFSSNQKMKIDENVRIEMVNGEYFHLLENLELKNEYEKRAIPKRINFTWWDENGQGYGAYVIPNEQEIINAFKKIFETNKSAEANVEFMINATNTFVAVKIKANGNEVNLKDSEVEVFKSKSVTQRFKRE